MSLPSNWLSIIKQEYPRRAGGNGWKAVERLVPKAISDGATWEDILAGTKGYARYVRSSGKNGSEFVRMARTFFGPDCWWEEFIEAEQDAAPATDWSVVAADLGIPAKQASESMEDFRRRIGIATEAKRRARLRVV